MPVCASPRTASRGDEMSMQFVGDRVSIFTMLIDLYDSAEIVQWMTMPNKQLGGRTPEGMMSEGKYEEVYALVKQLSDGVYT